MNENIIDRLLDLDHKIIEVVKKEVSPLNDTLSKLNETIRQNTIEFTRAVTMLDNIEKERKSCMEERKKNTTFRERSSGKAEAYGIISKGAWSLCLLFIGAFSGALLKPLLTPVGLHALKYLRHIMKGC